MGFPHFSNNFTLLIQNLASVHILLVVVVWYQTKNYFSTNSNAFTDCYLIHN